MLALCFCGGPAVYAADLRVPHFNLPGLDGKYYTDASLIGHTTLMVFWAPWCPVCRHELPEVHALYEKLQAKGLQVIAVGFADYKENIQRYVQSHPETFNFPVLYDPQDQASKRFGVFGTPTIYLFDKQGRLALKTWLIEDPRLKTKLDALLALP